MIGLMLNTIISLENNKKYVLVNETLYGGIKYFLAMGVDENKNLIQTEISILEEIIKGKELYVDQVTDPEMIKVLSGILEQSI